MHKWSLTTCNAQFAKERRPANRERGNPARWLTWKSPRIRIKWWKRQRWIMSVMQRGIILSKHGSHAHISTWFGAETLLSDSIALHCGLREQKELVHISGSQSAFQTASALRVISFYTWHVLCLIVCILSSLKVVSQAFSFKCNVKSTSCADDAAFRRV